MAITVPVIHAELPEDVAARVRAVTDQMNFYEKQIAEKREAVKQLNDEYFGLQVLCSEVKKKEEEVTQTLLELQNKVSHAVKELSSLQTSKSRLDEDAESVRTTLSKLRESHEVEKTALASTSKELESAKLATQEEKEKQAALRAHLEEIRKCIAEVSSKLMDI